MSTSARPVEIVVPDSVGSGCSPEASEPATTATVPVSAIAATA